MQHGKTIPDAKGSIQRGIEVVEYATGIDKPEINKRKKLITKKPLTNHLAGKPFAEVDLSLVVHDNSKKGIA